MAARVNINTLTTEQREIIKTHLYFTPQEFKPKNKYFSFNSKINTKKDVLFYIEDDEDVLLPYCYASSLLNYIPNQDHHYLNCNIEFTGNIRKYQEPVVEELQLLLKKHGMVTIGLYPGFGKTVVGAFLTTQLKLPAMILLHLDSLIIQHINTFLKNTNCRIWVVGKTKKVVNEIIKQYSERFFNSKTQEFFSTQGLAFDVIICMEERTSQIPLTIKKQIAILIIDEAHHFCTSSRVKAILSIEPLYIMIQTATPERSDKMHNMLYALVGTQGVFIEPNKHMKVFNILTKFEPETVNNKMGILDYDKLQKSTFSNPQRLNLILEWLEHNRGFRVLILTTMVSRCEELYQMINESFENNCDYIHGDKTEFYPHDILIGTVSKIGTGFDPLASVSADNIKHYQVVILDMSIKKPEVLTQTVGRVMRSANPIVIQMLDDHSIYQRHWKKNLTWYKKRKSTIIENMTNFDLTFYNITPD